MTPQDVNENGDLRESKRSRLTREIRVGSKAARRMLRGVHFSLCQVDISLECFLRTQLHPDLHEKVKCLAVDLEKVRAIVKDTSRPLESYMKNPERYTLWTSCGLRYTSNRLSGKRK